MKKTSPLLMLGIWVALVGGCTTLQSPSHSGIDQLAGDRVGVIVFDSTSWDESQLDGTMPYAKALFKANLRKSNEIFAKLKDVLSLKGYNVNKQRNIVIHKPSGNPLYDSHLANFREMSVIDKKAGGVQELALYSPFIDLVNLLVTPEKTPRRASLKVLAKHTEEENVFVILSMGSSSGFFKRVFHEFKPGQSPPSSGIGIVGACVNLTTGTILWRQEGKVSAKGKINEQSLLKAISRIIDNIPPLPGAPQP